MNDQEIIALLRELVAGDVTIDTQMVRNILKEEVPTKTPRELRREQLYDDCADATVACCYPAQANTVLKSLTKGIRDRLAADWLESADGTYEELSTDTQRQIDETALAALPITVEELESWDKQ